MTDTRIIRVPLLTRVEGEGALDLEIHGDDITSLRLRIFEPPRFFEKFLEGRHYTEVPDLVARICGICPVAYQMTAVQAFEALFQVDAGPWVRDMRRVFYCGEWLQSHSLHIHLLALPDFLGFDNVAAMAARYPDEVRRGLRLQALGNDIIRLLGGRSVHPVGVLVGGFSRPPEPRAVDLLLQRLLAAETEAYALLDWVLSLPLADSRHTAPTVSLTQADEYPIYQGRLAVSDGLEVALEDFEDHFIEQQVPHSTALHAHYRSSAGQGDGVAYLVGPLARLNLNRARLPAEVLARLAGAGIALPAANMFHSLVARAVEMIVAVSEAARLLQDYRQPGRPFVAVEPVAGLAFGCSEAPRGTLWHRYEVDAEGLIRSARIVPPTSQNQAHIEAGLKQSLLDFGLDRSDQELRRHAEAMIRNYDPCISCATHFLKLNLKRDDKP